MNRRNLLAGAVASGAALSVGGSCGAVTFTQSELPEIDKPVLGELRHVFEIAPIQPYFAGSPMMSVVVLHIFDGENFVKFESAEGIAAYNKALRAALRS